MGTLSLSSPLSLYRPPPGLWTSRSRLLNPNAAISWHPHISTTRGRKTSFARNSSNDPNESSSRFFDTNGVIEDMDGYLNYLSLEYDSVWDTKPSWCQPWTITLTGVSVIAGSWLILHSVAVTTLAISLIAIWWYIFLYSYPKAYSEMIAERRKRVSDGAEDTYGFEERKS